MLAVPIEQWELGQHQVAEPKFDGFRAILVRREDGTALVLSRAGTDMTAMFPEVSGPLAALSAPAVLDSELVIWEDGQLAFERLGPRLNRSGATAARLAAAALAVAVVFDVMHWNGTDYQARPYAQRRSELERLFAERALRAPAFNLCPSTADTATAEAWLRDWGPLGVEGLVIKDTRGIYRPGQGSSRGRGWRKWRIRHTAEAIVGAVTGNPSRPRSVLLGRYDEAGRLRYIGRSTALARPLVELLGRLLAPAGGGHPWEGRRFSAAWGSRDPLVVDLVQPEVVVEVAADISRDTAGRYRHPVRIVRDRPDLAPGDVATLPDPSADA